ncbi:DEAD/DEAH box helicase [Thermoactinomyces sp. CICC 23799]|uniref:DEAD/DEAH box helicase n=1 Tax=Thermoactinomyces sp. CICC 23799 TaxID=2767429 RepID=UPI0018DBD764|nr:DEAD/DEAH box helicase [Thermoactinomyces sp. CICC 23799]MBH8600505.1 DEAD/DEAH box helicase [Thermoactinomyces sp. CICC 23799]
MKFTPYPYQKRAIQHILDHPSAGLFLEMGLGKSVITLTAITELLHNSFEIERVLVIAPLRVADTVWTAEAEKWDHTRHLRISKVLGPKKKRIEALNTPADVYVINRENVEWIVNHYGRSWPFDMVVIDELSSFKSPSSRRFRALRKVLPLINRIVGLTGTPAPNGLIDLWSQIYLLDQGERLGPTITGYRNRYFIPGKRRDHIVYEWIPISEEVIYEKISDICISMKAEDWLDMPQRIDRTVTVTLPPAARARYKQLERDLLLPFADGDVVANTAAVLAGKLLQLANGAVYDENHKVQEIHKAKLEALGDIIEAANGKPILVFYTYQHDLHRIQKRFSVRTLESSKDISDWNAGRIPVLLAHPASAGHGLNLQAGGNTIVWFGLPHSLELYEQANARLYRQGQKENVIIYHLVTEGTIDENVMKALARKALTQNDLMQAVKARISEIPRSRGA